jgi:diguanylate cyclase (GGDEF)-like protein/PAS domain S-box-containing protein
MDEGTPELLRLDLRICDELPDALLIVDTAGIIRFANRPAHRLFRTEETLVGRQVEEFIPESARGGHAAMRARFHEHPASRSMAVRRNLTIRAADGTHIPVDIALNPIASEDQRYVVTLVRDASERRKFEDELRMQAVALNSVASCVAIGDANGRVVWVNRAFTATTGYTAEDVVGAVGTMFHFDDTELGLAVRKELLAGRTWHGESMRVRKDGTLYAEEQSLSPVLTTSSTLTHLVSVTSDVTARRRFEQEQTVRMSELELLHDLGQLADIVSSPEALARRAADLIRDSFGLPDVACSVEDVTSPAQSVDQSAPQPVAGESMVSMAIALESRHRRLGTFYCTIPVDSSLSLRWQVLTTAVRQLTVALERSLLITELQQLATTDSLTGLVNRRALFAELEMEISRSRRSGRPLSMLVFDLDHFKPVNDHYGHAAGDVVLARFGMALKTMVRTIDVVGRIGGEEFAVLLPESNLETAYQIAERIRAGLESMVFEVPGKCLTVTASIGAAELGTSESSSQLFVRADSALYRAKESGRNRIEVAAQSVVVSATSTTR